MSCPRSTRSVTLTWLCSRMDLKPLMRGRLGRWKPLPVSTQLNGMRLTTCGVPRTNSDNASACSGVSLSSLIRRYSIITLRPVMRWYFFIASQVSATFHRLLTGMSLDRISSMGLWRDRARWMGSLSSASLRI